MDHLDDVKELIAKGDKAVAIRSLFSALQKNSNDVEAWLLLGGIIDDITKKRDCYNKVLKLSPNHPVALDGLRNLEISSITSPKDSSLKPDDTQPTRLHTSSSKEQIQGLRDDLKNNVNPKPSQPDNVANNGWKTGLFGILGLAAFLGISYLIGFMGSEDGTNNICSGMICLLMFD